MDVAEVLRDARRRAGLTQTGLAELTGTSQATISAYERGEKEPTLATLDRLLTATGRRLSVRGPRARRPSRGEMKVRGNRLAEVLALAEALPARHRARLSYPQLAPLRAARSQPEGR
jgi:transcriptional regulator with XRE-family HTH domain